MCETPALGSSREQKACNTSLTKAKCFLQFLCSSRAAEGPQQLLNLPKSRAVPVLPGCPSRLGLERSHSTRARGAQTHTVAKSHA